MFLLLDLAKKDTLHLALFDAESVEHKNYNGMNRELLFAIDDFLLEKNLNKKDVQGIAVVVGAGGFTSTRVATTIANAWAYIQKIPVIAVTPDEATDPRSFILKLFLQTTGHFVSATYSAEPNVGQL